MMLYGRFEHNMDAKGRIFVPVKLREKLGETFIAACVLDKCVSLYSMEEWDSLLQKIAEAPMAETRKLLRKVTESAEDVTPDAQGRILLNKNLIEEAGRLNVPGRPIQYKTTPDFLRTFGLSSLEELPPIDKITFGEPIEIPEESKAEES